MKRTENEHELGKQERKVDRTACLGVKSFGTGPETLKTENRRKMGSKSRK